MTNFFGTNKIVPNGYIYTSHKGSEYIVLEGVWFKHDNLKMVDPSKTHKMNEAAIAQIMNHNSTSKNLIGESFDITGNTYVYLGEGRFTENGIVITEDALPNELLSYYELPQNNIKVTEAIDSSDFSNFKKADPNKVEIPSGFKVGEHTYMKNKGVWQSGGTAVTDKTFNKELNTDAINKIKELNKTEAYPINSTIEYKGEPLVWNGLSWIDSKGKQYKSSKFLDNIDEFIATAPKSDSTSGEQEGLSGVEKGLEVGKSRIVDKNGKVFIYQGGDQFVNPDDESVLPTERALQHIKRYKQHQKGITATTDLDTGVTSTASNATPEPAPGQSNSTEPSSPAPSESGKGTSSIPDGFMITSKAGVQYLRKAGQWISSKTKKPMNASAAKSIDMAAERKISEHNASSPVKIGDTWTSSKNKEYTYVGDERFVSADGKMIPKSSAKQIFDKLSNEKQPEPAQNEPEGQQGQPEPEVQPTNEPEVQPEPTNEPEAQPEDTQAGGSPLDALAQEIKKHPKARKITVLLTRGDKVSLLAADLILSGKESEALDILKALNSNDGE